MDLSNISQCLSKKECASCPNLTSCNVLQSTLEWVVGYSYTVESSRSNNHDENHIEEIRSYLVPDESSGQRCRIGNMEHSEVSEIQDSVVDIFHRQQNQNAS